MHFLYLLYTMGRGEKGQQAALSGLRKTVTQCSLKCCCSTKSGSCFPHSLPSCSSIRLAHWLPEHIDPKITSKRLADRLKMCWGGGKGWRSMKMRRKPDPSRGRIVWTTATRLFSVSVLNVTVRKVRMFKCWLWNLSSSLFLTIQQYWVLDELIDYSWSHLTF